MVSAAVMLPSMARAGPSENCSRAQPILPLPSRAAAEERERSGRSTGGRGFISDVRNRFSSSTRGCRPAMNEPCIRRHIHSEDVIVEWEPASPRQDTKLEPAKLAEAVIAELPRVRPSSKVECAICFEAADGVEEWRALPCGHSLHGACLCEMVKTTQQRRCPLCRMDILACADLDLCPDITIFEVGI